MYFNQADFVKSVDKIENKPEKHLNEVLFVGKSNVGKSSLINALTNHSKLAFTSSKPGHTRLLNYYIINKKFYFVDCPGYGFSSQKDLDYEFYGELIENYFKDNKDLKLVIFLLDSRHEPTKDDITFFNFLKETNYNFVLVMTKCDKLNQSMRSKIEKNLIAAFGDIDDIEVLLTSIKDNRTLINLELLINSFVG